MSYDIRDFIFDLCKEVAKENWKNNIHTYCENLRRATFQLPIEDRKAALLLIDKCENDQIENINKFLSNITTAKEILKLLN